MLVLDTGRIDHIRRLEVFLKALGASPAGGRRQPARGRSLWRKLGLVFRGMCDLWRLAFLVVGGRQPSSIVFVAKNLVLYEKHLATMDLGRTLFIGYHQTEILDSFLDNRVLNIGLLVGMAKRLTRRERSMLGDARLFSRIHRCIRPLMSGSRVFIPCYYDANGLALIMSDRRDLYEVIEVQHGGICNFEPYTRPVPFRVADRILVADNRTADYLKHHLCSRVPVEIDLMESEKPECVQRVDNEIPVILYCSSIEVGGVHEGFLSFLTSCDDKARPRLRVRLHPRELDRKDLFKDQLGDAGWDFDFDDSPDWLAGNPFVRLVVVTPWSSVVEEGVREGIRVVILDEFGRERFRDLIDDRTCWYEDGGGLGLAQALKSFEESEINEEWGG